MKKLKVILLISLISGLVLLLGAFWINYSIHRTSKSYIYKQISHLPSAYTGLVLGAFVYPSGRPSDILQDRLDSTVELYQQGKIKRILVSGDHGQNTYDEVNHMKNYLLKQGIPGKDIFLDHAGFNTYNSLYRAKVIFEVQDAILITQAFHLPRAIYIARKLGMNAYGYTADKHRYLGESYNAIREFLARFKSFWEVTFRIKPKFLGEKIPITGTSKNSWD